jgi:hypothetical protein
MRIHRPDTGSLGTQQAIKLRAEDRLISPARYADLEQRLRQQLNKSSINLEDMKQLLATRPEFMQFCFDNTPSEQKHSASSSVTVIHR